MHLISLNTAAALTGLTKRTLWRYIESGRLTVANPTASRRNRLKESPPPSRM
ncbi:hypothetical protein [Allochromatium palmeri]|uniref:Helix-turn-helix domain-containing protein n=1 Tax=Allochromatium palmeri TaxID=231048 RepID=A0A6N8EHB8_9GAMM|nr:hypothetical protein [Allochromatium palmeri]MTW22096.1 hypothetical protein [Allochromatium palmeri]